MVTLCLSFRGTAKPFSAVTVPFYIPASKVWGFRPLYILANTCDFPFFFFFFYSILVGSEWYPRWFKKNFFWLKTCGSFMFSPLPFFAFCSQYLPINTNSWHSFDIYHVLGAVLNSFFTCIISFTECRCPWFYQQSRFLCIDNPEGNYKGEAESRYIALRKLEIGRNKFMKPCTFGNNDAYYRRKFCSQKDSPQGSFN